MENRYEVVNSKKFYHFVAIMQIGMKLLNNKKFYRSIAIMVLNSSVHIYKILFLKLLYLLIS